MTLFETFAAISAAVVISAFGVVFVVLTCHYLRSRTLKKVEKTPTYWEDGVCQLMEPTVPPPHSMKTQYLLQEGFLSVVIVGGTFSLNTDRTPLKYFEVSPPSEFEPARLHNKVTDEYTDITREFVDKWGHTT